MNEEKTLRSHQRMCAMLGFPKTGMTLEQRLECVEYKLANILEEHAILLEKTK